MHSDDGMGTLDEFGTSSRVLAIEILMSAAENRILSVNDLAEVWGKLLVGSIAGRPKSVSADAWDSIVVEVSDSCRLSFMDKILRRSGLVTTSSKPWE